MTTVLRPLSFSELLDRTFFLYRKNFWLFVGIIALPYLAILATEILGLGLVFAKLTFVGIGVVVAGVIIYLLAIAASQAATVVAVSDVHLGRPATIGGSFRAIKGGFLRIVLVMIGMWIAIAIACIPAGLSFFLIVKSAWAIPLPFLLGIPVIALCIAWSLVIPVAVLEGSWLIGAMSRSFFLTKGSLGRIFLICLIFAFLTAILLIIVQVPMLILVAVLAGMRASVTAILVAQGMSYVISFIASILVAPFFAIGIALIYFDQRVRKEGFDLQLMMATLQPAAQTTPMVGAS
jgi:hypothetical protein